MTETARLVIAVDSTQVSRADSALQKFGQTTTAVERQSDALSSAVSRLAGPLAALTAGVSIKSLIDISDNYGQMADRIRMATDTTQEYVMVQDRLLQSANKTYRPLVEAQELYIRTADAIRSLGYETSDALDITDSFSYLLVTNAASADRASSAINAYSKSIQTGKVDSESWQSILAAMPSVVETLANELGRSSNEIRDLGITGKLALADLNEGLRRSVEETKAAADGMGTTLNDAIIRASNNWSAYLGESEKVTGASRLMSGALDTVSENLSTVASIASGVAVAGITRYSVALAQNTSAAVLNYRAKQVQAAEELRAAQAQAASTAAALAQARANVGLVGSIGSVTAATAAHEAAQKRLAAAQAATMGVGRSMLGLMGGPVGLIATVGLTALSFVEFGDKAKGGMDKAANATEQAAMRIRNATRNLLPSDIGTLSYDSLQEQVAQVEGQLTSARAELERFQRNFDAGNISEEWLDKPREKVAALEGALSKLKGEMDGVRFASDTAGESYANNLERQAVLVGKVTEEERLRAMVKAGYIKLSKEALETAIENARQVDAVNAALKNSKTELKEQANAYQALYDRLYPAEAAQRRYTEEVDRLKAVLKGNELADAIARLNAEMLQPGADATGPADAIEEYRKELERLEDKINPAGKAAKDFAAEQKRLREEIERTGDPTGKWTALLQENERQFEQNTRATSEWAKWTEGALDRVDSAFADAWRNIGDGFSSFRDSLTNAFKQMLAELAHMAITKPIIMQIGAAMGIGGGTQGNNGIWGSLLGGGSASGGSGGIGGALQAANQARSIYSMYGTAQTLLPVLQGGYASGGIGGALTGIGSYVGSLFGGAGTAASMAAGSTAAGYTGSGMAAWVAAQNAAAGGAAAAGAGGIGGAISGALSSMASMWYLAPIIGAWQSGKLYDAGVRPDAGEMWKSTQGNTLGQIGNVLPTLQSKFFEVLDKGLEKASFGLVNGKLAAMISGSTFHQALWGGINKKLFGGAWETKDGGIALGATDGDLTAQQYIYQKKKGGLFSSSKKRTRYSALDDETLAMLQDTYDATEAGVAELFEALSLSVEDGSLAGLQLARKQISTKGKTEEQISEAINAWFGDAANAMTAELNKVFATGLDLDLEGMQAFVGNLQGVNEVLRYLDVGMYDASVSGGKLAEALSAAAGGLDALAANSATYYGAFFSEAEKIEDTIDSIKRAFESADVELAASREAYRAMVEDIDLTTEAGQKMFATLMALSGQAAQYFSIVEQQAAQKAAEAAALLMGTVNTAYAALQRSIAAQQREIQASASKAAGNISALTGIGNSLDAALKKLRGTSDDTVRSLRAQAVMTLNSALVQARSGQSLAGVEGLQDALDTASQMDTALYGSLIDFEREQGRTANLIAELEKVNGKQLSVEEKLLKQYEAQLSKLDQELLFAQAQLDALNGVDASVMSVAEAIKAMNASVVAALSLMGGDTGKNATPQNVGTLAESVYRSVLGRQADAAGLAYWQQQVASGAIRLDQLEQAIKNAARANGEIPAFARGGFHSGGLRLVGENGPELEVTGPSRIYNASQTAAMLGGGAGSEAELRALRGEVAGLRSALGAIAKYTESTAYGVRQINEIGIPQSEVA
ncbi:tape measure protein [Stutzerimonas stutzeri]|uniref:tape measure protein n=1 Tax=Stutzerimonas stutzeri TaxID=316 RepID=UPI0018A95AE2|nr:tape measure protein [Stutzerimonas stutzeri]QPI08262.1 tape measure protein [Stutzerimonas stutzeri]